MAYSRSSKRQLAALARDLQGTEPDYIDETGAKPNKAEIAFARMARGRGKAPIRNGWPDFLVHDELSGGTIAVEVKQGGDDVSRAQARMFQALERAGIIVMVWDPARPRALQPWRRYYDDKPAPQPVDMTGARHPVLARMPPKNRREQ